MSSLIVEVCRVAAVRPHPNADRMAAARIKGWEVCVAKNEEGEPRVKEGDLVVYVPPDSVVPPDTAERHGVAKYLTPLPKRADGSRPEGGRVRVASLRGFQSYGYLAKPDDPAWELGRDVALFVRPQVLLPVVCATCKLAIPAVAVTVRPVEGNPPERKEQA